MLNIVQCNIKRNIEMIKRILNYFKTEQQKQALNEYIRTEFNREYINAKKQGIQLDHNWYLTKINNDKATYSYL